MSQLTIYLRVSVIYQNCRYAKKTQISLDLNKYRYVGDSKSFKAVNWTVCIADINISQKESRIQDVVYDSLTLN